MKELVRHTAGYIASVQQPNGAIPWFADGTIDPWDHVEAAMGLSNAGAWTEAKAAYRWLASQQRPNGSWMAAYQGEIVVDGTRAETNFVAYVATGVWLHYLVSNDDAFVETLWPTVRRAIDFTLSLQVFKFTKFVNDCFPGGSTYPHDRILPSIKNTHLNSGPGFSGWILFTSS